MGVRINLHHILTEHAKGLTGGDYLSVVEAVESLLNFMTERLTVSLRDQGVRHDIAAAAAFATVGTTVIFFDQLVKRVEALAAFLATDDGANLLAGYKRASNILKAEEKKGPLPEGTVATGLANQPAEETALAFAAGRRRDRCGRRAGDGRLRGRHDGPGAPARVRWTPSSPASWSTPMWPKSVRTA